jgi:hypothetical protein
MSTTDDFRAVVNHLRSWGFKVVEWSGCYGRSNGGGWSAGKPVGHVNHHYVCSMNPDQGYINGLCNSLANGSVVNWFADVHGVAYLIGTGPMNHAGTGNQSVLDRTRNDQPPASNPASSAGSISGNSHYSGTECQHPGDSTPWPGPMLDVMVAINAAEFVQWGYSENRAINHSEWSSRKIDMSAGGGVNSGGWSAAELRRRVSARMSGTAPAPGPGPGPGPEPEPKPVEDDMPRRILTVYDAAMNPLAQALDGPTGVVVLTDPVEADCVRAVIDADDMVNQVQIDVYNAVLARGNQLSGS